MAAAELQTLHGQVAAAQHRNQLLKSALTDCAGSKDLEHLYTEVFESEKTGPDRNPA